MKKRSIQKIYKAIALAFLMVWSADLSAQTETMKVDRFDEVTISPFIEVTFKKGDSESVIIEDLQLPKEKLNVEVKSKKLHIFIDDTKITSPTKKVQKNGSTMKVPLYDKTMVKLTVIYKDVETFSLRGEEKMVFESPIDQKELKLNLYGESRTVINDINADEMRVKIYGESHLEIKKGTIEKQRFTAYGESEVDATGVSNKTTKITAYGDGDYRFNISDLLKVTAYGEAYIGYKGSPRVRKGLIIGDSTIRMIK